MTLQSAGCASEGHVHAALSALRCRVYRDIIFSQFFQQCTCSSCPGIHRACHAGKKHSECLTAGCGSGCPQNPLETGRVVCTHGQAVHTPTVTKYLLSGAWEVGSAVDHIVCGKERVTNLTAIAIPV